MLCVLGQLYPCRSPLIHFNEASLVTQTAVASQYVQVYIQFRFLYNVDIIFLLLTCR